MRSRTHSRRLRARTLAAAVVLAAPLVLPSQVQATARTFLTAGGLWQTAANWTGGVVPQAGDDVFITNNDAISRTVTYLDSVSLHSFQINQLGTGTNTLMFSLGEMDSNLELIGTTGKGVYTQTAGLNSLTVNAATLGFLIGQSAGSAGTYSLSGAAVLQVTGSGANLGDVIGNSGAGTFIQTGGNHLLNGNAILTLGNNSTGFGTYNLSGGSLNSATLGSLAEVVGSTGSALFLQSGGTNTISGSGALVIANNGGSNGTYNISATATLSVNTSETVGNLGAGTFLQSAGVGSVGGQLTLGAGTTGVGFYQLSGTGSLTTGSEVIGSSNIGTFTQQGGSNDALQGMTLGLSNSSIGVYSISGGTLTVEGSHENLDIGEAGTGTFNQTGGAVVLPTDNTNDLTVGCGTAGGVGVYNLTGPGSLSVVSGSIGVGTSTTGGAGTFNQSAGTVSTQGIKLGSGATTGGAGTYLLSTGATLTVPRNSVFVNIGGQFIQTGGNHIIGVELQSSTSLTQLDINGGHYRLSGGTLQVNGVDGLIAGSFEQVGGLHILRGLGLIEGTQNGVGTYLLSGGTFTQTPLSVLQQDLSIQDLDGLSILDNGSLVGTVNGFLNANAHLQGGTVSGVLQNQGTFTFDGGTFSAQLMNSGTFNLNGNTLSTASITINNELGTFNGPGTVTGAMNNFGVINSNGTLSTGTMSNFGLINVGTNSALAPSSMVNSGQINLTRGELNGAGSINNSGGVIAGGGTISLALTQNAGTIRADIPDSPMVIKGPLQITFPTSQFVIANNCTMNIANGLFNTANITLQGPGAKLIGNGSILNSGTVSGPGQINSVLSNGGLVRVTGGELLLAGAGDVNNSNGTFSIGSGGTITVVNGLTNNSGTILLASGAFDNGPAPLNNPGMITGRGSISSGTISNGGTIVFSGGTNDFLAPLTNSNRTTLTGNSLTTFYSPVDTTTGTLTVNLGSTAVFLGPVTGLGHIAGAGVKDFEGGASAGPIATLTGTTIVGVDGNLNAASVRDNTLNVVGNAVVLPNGTFVGTSRVNNLIIDGTTNNWSGRFDLSNNDLIVDYSGASPLGTIANQIRSGFANGNWTGPGISSASAALAAGSLHKTALGYAEASTLNITLFSGDSVDNSSVLVRYTWSGDANLDGIVNLLDFNALATNFGVPSGKLWSDADFNYDNIINTLDFNALASNFDEPAFASPPLGTLIPEPAGVLMVLLSYQLLLPRRRKHL